MIYSHIILKRKAYRNIRYMNIYIYIYTYIYTYIYILFILGGFVSYMFLCKDKHIRFMRHSHIDEDSRIIRNDAKVFIFVRIFIYTYVSLYINT